MTRNDLISRSRRLASAADVIASFGTRRNATERAYFLARGRFSDVLAMAAQIASAVPQSAYALTA
jgi:hypothetical protein